MLHDFIQLYKSAGQGERKGREKENSKGSSWTSKIRRGQSFAKSISLPMGARHCNCSGPQKGISLCPLTASKMLDFCYTALRSNLVKALTVNLIGLTPAITCEEANRYNSCDRVQFCNGGRKGVSVRHKHNSTSIYQRISVLRVKYTSSLCKVQAAKRRWFCAARIMKSMELLATGQVDVNSLSRSQMGIEVWIEGKLLWLQEVLPQISGEWEISLGDDHYLPTLLRHLYLLLWDTGCWAGRTFGLTCMAAHTSLGTGWKSWETPGEWHTPSRTVL